MVSEVASSGKLCYQDSRHTGPVCKRCLVLMELAILLTWVICLL